MFWIAAICLVLAVITGLYLLITGPNSARKAPESTTKAPAPDSNSLDDVLARFCQKPKDGRSVGEIDVELAAANADLAEQKRKYQVTIAKLLPIEKDLKVQVEAEHQRLITEKTERISNLRIARFDVTYPRLDIGFLSQKRKSSPPYDLPVFCLFSTRSAIGGLRATGGMIHDRYSREVSTHSFEPGPALDILRRYWPELYSRLGSMAEREGNNQRHGRTVCTEKHATLAAEFGGVLSEPTRRTIRELEGRFDEIFLVTKAPAWEIAVDRCFPVTGKVLVVGSKGNLYWLITSDQITPFDEYLENQMASQLQLMAA